MVEINREKVGERINNIRNAGDWTLEEFGTLINNTSRGNVSNWINGKNIPTKEKLNLIALLGRVKPEFLLYGDMEEYSKEFFGDYKGTKLDEEFWKSFREILTKKGIPYEDKERMIQYAIMAKETLREDKEFYKFSLYKGVMVETVSYYDVEKNSRYRRNYLPLLDDMLRSDNEEEYVDPTYNKAILHTLDMLIRIGDEKIKQDIVSIIIILSRISNRNIIMTDNTYLPKVSDSPSLGGYTFQSPVRSEQKRSEKEIEQDYKELKKLINETLDNIIKRNIAMHRV
ncbi:transcriptional regulator [Bacillus thuringiensis serovar zhaodongensis]|uniref:helix-turn-helix domain-containing protein n=1 Tax=Bacillus thuringiensis TaxID=1428 RepID=UPI000A3C6FA3|nr:helix-turn-helix transcriptional regulator [Bacillus thuringiensis]OUB70661.1 transcriptional regulator [Bacillus thuringiensis serovar zhaodongensis]